MAFALEIDHKHGAFYKSPYAFSPLLTSEVNTTNTDDDVPTYHIRGNEDLKPTDIIIPLPDWDQDLHVSTIVNDAIEDAHVFDVSDGEIFFQEQKKSFFVALQKESDGEERNLRLVTKAF